MTLGGLPIHAEPEPTEAALGYYIHSFLPGEDTKRIPLLLLHRTGGDEGDLVPLARRIAPGSAILALRGNVLEAGRPRFFRRVGQGDFDRDDFKLRTGELGAFVAAACRHYRITLPVALGHSNGANIVWSLMLAGTRVLSGAILFRPMLPFDPHPIADLKGFPVLITAGDSDPIVVPQRAEDLPRICREAGADVTYKLMAAAHDLVEEDERAARRWLGSTPATVEPSGTTGGVRVK